MRDVLRDAEELLAAGEPVAVAMVVDTRRSAPRPLGLFQSFTARARRSGANVSFAVRAGARATIRQAATTPAATSTPANVASNQIEAALLKSGE